MTSPLMTLKNGIVLGMLLGLAACSSVKQPMDRMAGRVAEVLKPYRTEVVQGNVVTREQLQMLRNGMTRLQVRDLLGTPLITSVFHANRWDYAFTIRRQGAEPLNRKLSVFFDGDAMVKVESDELPLEAEFAAKLDTRRPASKPPQLEAAPEALKAFKPASPVSTPAQAAPAAALPEYPPLEPAR
jgi:outer membrane protein assembly factor BamE